MLPSFKRALIALAALSFAAPAAGVAALDFGDAPDRGRGLAGFPSLLASDGARAGDVSYAWMGPRVDAEDDSRQVDRDPFDDGVSVRLAPCRTSTALVQVTVPAIPQQGTAYLNLFFDWNRNGSWGGQDPCAPEWRVRNLAIDLAGQGATTRVYAVSFPAGRQVSGLWYRAILSVDRRITSEAGTGAFPRGEVEDHFLPGPRPRRFGAYCDPNPLAIEHGAFGLITVRPAPGSAPITFVGLANSTPGLVDGGLARTRARNIRVAGKVLLYRSKRVDPPPRTVQEIVGVRVRFGRLASIVIKCEVRVVHAQPRKLVLVPDGCTLTGVTSEWLPQPSGVTPSGGAVAGVRGHISQQSTAWRAQCGIGDGPPHGIRIELPPGMRAGFAQVILGDPAGPQARTLPCDNTAGTSVTCLGPDPLPPEAFFDIFIETGAPPRPGEALPIEIVQLHLVALDPGGRALGGIESVRKSGP